MALVTKPKRTPKAHEKRRSGQHHRHNDHYLKPYWPYLPLLLVVGIGIAVNSVWGTVQKGVLGYATDVSIGSLLQNTNDQRAGNALGALALNNQLDQAAQAKANDMAARDYWSHNTPDGNAPWVFITAAGYHYQTAGENLAYGFDTSANTLTAWMNSPEHRANVLNTSYKDVGFGIANVANYQGTGPETIVVAMYGSPQQVASAPASSPAAAAPAAASDTAAPAASAPTETPAPQIAQEKPAETNATAAAPAPQDGKQPAKPAETRSIARIQLLASSRAAPWSAFAVSAIATICLIIFLLRHSLLWHRALVKGERFIMKHKTLDIVLVGVAMLGIILTRVVGVIR